MNRIATDDILTSDEKLRLQRMCVYERKAYRQGYRAIAGVDEAGRGPLAGPVVAAVCIIPRGLLFAGVNDSKQLPPIVRKRLFQRITSHPLVQYAVGYVDSVEIDRINIYQATIQAMLQAIDKLQSSPDYILVDGMNLPHPFIACERIVSGDQLSFFIAAASIIAKEIRDELMLVYHDKWPQYGFDRHKGYGTPQHLKALDNYGPCEIHRHSFAPIKNITN